MFSNKISVAPTIEYLLAENKMLRDEIKVGREASAITAKLVVKQFEETEKMLRKFQRANAERQAVLDAATQLSIIASDLDGTITLFSSGAANLLGYSADEMVGRRNIVSLHIKEEIQSYGEKLLKTSNTEFDFLDDSSLAWIDVEESAVPAFEPVKVFDQYVKQKISQSSDWTYIKKDGSHLPINLSITPFYNARGSLRGYLFTAMDMSTHKLMEQELIEAIKNAESANASKGNFLARMSHEIRTPMNGILGMAHLLRKTELSAKQSNYIDKILSSANNLLNLINDILDFSKIDAGKMELELVEFNLQDVLNHLMNSVGLHAEEKSLEFIFNIDQRVPLNLLGDPLRLGQVLTNLAGNAVKFTEHGEVVISVSIDELSGAGNVDYKESREITLKFSVQDTGIGLYPDQIQSLFEPFSQADDSITRKYGGTGLGLSICRQLTEMMGGKIWVHSAPGHGADFIFTAKFRLPQKKDNSIVSSDSYEPFKEVSALSSDLNDRDRNLFKSMRFKDSLVLLVEDNPINQEVATEFLREAGITVRIASNGLEALNMIDKEPFDLVLMDIQMPVMDGLVAANKIRNEKKMINIPIVAMTAHAMSGDREKSFDAGMNGHLTKPVDPVELYKVLEQFILNKDNLSSKSDAYEDSCSYGQIENSSDKLFESKTNLIDTELSENLLSANRDIKLPPFLPIEGIDHKIAIKRLNNKTDMFISILNDFKKNYANEPAKIRELLGDGKFEDIQMKAHTLKGVAGYMGADALFQSASKLEDSLKDNGGSLFDGVDNLIELLINSLENTLKSLEVLPSNYSYYTNLSLSYSIEQENSSVSLQNGIDEDNRVMSQYDIHSSVDMLNKFMRLLRNGDTTVIDMFKEVGSILKDYDYNREWIKIAELIDDIEYEAAGDIVQKIVQEFMES
ncbi:MAG: ATP-binding protein [Desulfamplus sp.]